MSAPAVTSDPNPSSGSWTRVAVALVCAGQGMAFGLAANQTPPDTPGAFWVLHGGLAASAIVVLALLGGPLVRESIIALRAGRITVDLLFLVSLLGAFGASVFSTIRREGPVFYELVAILLAIYTVGKMLGARSRARALQAVEALRAEHAVALRVLTNGTHERTPVEHLRVGDHVLVAPGETIAVDGAVRTGRSLVWTTPLTGEPEPSLRAPGDRVLAGMRAVDGTLVIEVTAAAGARRLDTMLRELEDARLAPARLQAEADRLAARFVPLVLLASVGTFAFWFSRGPLAPAVEHALAVLVVACPCALGLATPLGVWAALVRLGRLGIVANNGDFVDTLAAADVAFFDKTGTLCEPALRVSRVSLLPGSPCDEPELRAAIAAAESGISHPVAEALRSVANSTAGAPPRFELVEARVVPGGGIVARVREIDSGRILALAAGPSEPRALAGSAAVDDVLSRADVARRSAASVRAVTTSEIHAHAFPAGPATDEIRPTPASGLRRILITVDHVPAALVELDEQLRAAAAGVFRDLRSLGLRVEILTGDPAFDGACWPDISRATGLTPEEKSTRVRAAQDEGARVLFVGDGLNDAPALAAADVAIALRHGPELARSHALAVMSGESIGTLPDAVRLTRSVRRAIRSNLRFAVLYNTGAMTLAAAGLVHPVLAALLMAGSSAIVSTRVLRAANLPAAPKQNVT